MQDSKPVDGLREYVSFSRLAKLYDCGEMYRRRYLAGEKEPSSVAAEAGTAFHKAVERWHGEDAGSDLLELTKEEFRSIDGLADLAGYYRPEFYFTDKFPQWCRNYLRYIEKHPVEILHSEFECKVKLADDLPPLYGFIDQVFADSEGRLVLRDLKTGKRKPTLHALQIEFYIVAWNLLHPDEQVSYGSVLYVGENKTSVKVDPVIPTQDRESLAMQLRSLTELKHLPIQGPVTGACSFCGFANDCQFGRVGQMGVLFE